MMLLQLGDESFLMSRRCGAASPYRVGRRWVKAKVLKFWKAERKRKSGSTKSKAWNSKRKKSAVNGQRSLGKRGWTSNI